MRNRGQTTIFFSLMISVLLVFTLTALEAARIHMANVKVRAVMHSACQNLMADYDRELFARYHLLFMDPTYGTRSEAKAEELVCACLGESLDGGGRIYSFDVEEVAVIGLDPVFADHMKNLRRQIAEYEKTEGLARKAAGLKDRLLEKKSPLKEAEKETEINAVELPVPEVGSSRKAAEKTDAGSSGNAVEKMDISVEDPREQMKNCLKNGLLSFVLPGDRSISSESYGFQDPPSEAYKESAEEEERDAGFGDILSLKKLLKGAAEDSTAENLAEHAAFVDYVAGMFSNGLHEREDSEIKCETEYILKGKDSDYDNLQSVLTEITWLRMPVNYAYLLTDVEKKSEALTVAAAICTATGTEALIEVVKYLLLGCWAYGESVSEMRDLMAGKRIPYMKDALTWKTDLKNIGAQVQAKEIQYGLDYEDYLMLLLAKKRDQTACCARMLDVMEKNVRRKNPDFHIADCAGGALVQAKLRVNPLFRAGGNVEAYDICVEDTFHYYGK